MVHLPLTGWAAADQAASAGAPARARRINPARLARGLTGWILPLAILALWLGLTLSGLVRASLLPAPQAVVEGMLALAGTGELFAHLGATAWRVAAGFALGAGIAVPLGAVCGLVPTVRRLLDPTMQMLRAVPSLAWVPLFILWLGIAEASKVALIALGVFLPVYLNVLAAVGQVDGKLIEVARAFRLGWGRRLRRVVLPAALPGLFVGLRAGLALGWMFVVAAELMGASEGLGFLMVDGQSTGRPDLIIGALILFALCGKATDTLLAAFATRLLAWQDTIAASER